MELRVKNAIVAGAIVAVTATPLRDPTGAVTGAIALLRDVTQQRNLEQQLAQSQKMEAIGQLAGGVAHDFNNLLTVIVGCSELALEGFATIDARRDNVVEVLAAARHATLLTQQLLAFSRKQVVQARPLQLNDVVVGMNNMLRRLIGSHIQLSTVLRPELSLVLADQSQLEQVVLNLVVNARDAMSDGGVLRVETEEDSLSESVAEQLGVRPGRYVVLTVTDTGLGMSEETRQRLFEPFFTTKEVGKGTGLGLSQVYGFAKQSGGTATVASTVGRGTAITLYLPRTQELPAPSTAPMKAEAAPRRAGTVLVVEDSPEVAEVATAYFQQLGYMVKQVATANEALELLAKDAKIDLVFSDILMPGGMNGLELGHAIRRRYPAMPVLLATGYSDSVRDAVEQGFIVLQKPFDLAALEQALREARTPKVEPAPGIAG